jgi:hypothetical protein
LKRGEGWESVIICPVRGGGDDAGVTAASEDLMSRAGLHVKEDSGGLVGVFRAVAMSAVKPNEGLRYQFW